MSSPSKLVTAYVCRICFTQSCGKRVSFDGVSKWSKMFEYCIGLPICGQNAPLVFCESCAQLLQDFTYFKKSCIKSENIWKSLSSQGKNEEHRFTGTQEIKVEVTNEEYIHGKASASSLESKNNDIIRHVTMHSTSERCKTCTIIDENKNKNTTDVNSFFKGLGINQIKYHIDSGVRKLKTKYNLELKENKEIEEFEYLDLNVTDQEDKSDLDLEVTNDVETESNLFLNALNEKERRLNSNSSVTTDKNKTEQNVLFFAKNEIEIQDSLDTGINEIETKSDFNYEYVDENYQEDFCMENKSSLSLKKKKPVSKKRKRRKLFGQCDKCGREYVQLYLKKHIQRCGVDKLEHLVSVNSLKNENPKSKLRKLSTIQYCGICDLQSNDCKAVRQHFSDHCTNNDLECKLCDYVGKDIAHMVSHRYIHHPKDVRHIYYCPACPKIFQAMLKLEFHYRSVHLNKKGGLCSVCYKVSGSYKRFRDHHRFHLGDKFICDICGQKYLFRYDIESHMSVHENTRNYICDTCGKAYKRNSQLKEHIANLHTPSERVRCTHCKRMYKNQRCLKVHMRRVSKEKKYICNVCSKGFTSVKFLDDHMNWHSNERAFACHLCDSKYKYKSNLQVHIKTHAGFKSYNCSLCDKSFMFSNQLKRHQSVHTGVRPAKCLHCDRSFYTRRQMNEHCAKKHKTLLEKDFNDYTGHDSLKLS